MLKFLKGFSTFPWLIAFGMTILPGFINCGGSDGCLSHCFTFRYNGEPACLSQTCSTIGNIDKTKYIFFQSENLARKMVFNPASF